MTFCWDFRIRYTDLGCIKEYPRCRTLHIWPALLSRSIKVDPSFNTKALTEKALLQISGALSERESPVKSLPQRGAYHFFHPVQGSIRNLLLKPFLQQLVPELSSVVDSQGNGRNS